jgi:membrane-associated phospholipid phosphatase
VLGAASRQARADEAPPPTKTKPIQLGYDLTTDLTATAALTATLLTWGLLVKPNLDAPSCVICDGANGKVNGLDDFFRSSLKLPSGSPAGLLSDVVAYGVAPVTGIALATVVSAADRRGDEAATDILLVLEASLTFTVAQQGLSAAVSRERPEVHAAQGDERTRALARHSSLESFPAGHNGSAFAIAAAGGTVATMRGYRLAPLVWMTGGVLALTASYLRIAADRHYFTDVAVGAALGVGIGIGVPLLFHRPVSGERASAVRRWVDGATLSTSEVPGGRVVGIGSSF